MHAPAKEILNLFEKIKSDWAVCDDSDADDFMVLVNESRDVQAEIKPKKSLIEKLERQGLIKLDTDLSDEKGKTREYMDLFNGPEPVPFVYFYEVTELGERYASSLLEKQS